MTLSTVAAASLACVAPWVARNYRVHGEFVPIKSSFGYAFWQGNCAASQGKDKVVRASVGRALAGARGAVAERLHVHPQTVRYRLGQLRELFGEDLDDPDRRFALMVALRLRRPAAPGTAS